MTKKGIKMNISKCLKGYDIEKSETMTTEIRGQHKHTEGFKFFEDDEIMFLEWFDDNMEKAQKVKNLELIHEILTKHGFKEYMKLDVEEAKIMLDEQGF